MADKGLEDLFSEMLEDIYYAEQEILIALPEMQEAAESEQLRSGFARHREETEGQLRRLEQVFSILGSPPQSNRCDGIEGILKEGRSVMRQFTGTSAGDAGLIASAQAVEHYEITRYGTLRRWAEMLGLDDAARLFAQTLAEESATDDLLTQIADESANLKAAEAF